MVSQREFSIIKRFCPITKKYNDPANGLIAFDLDTDDYDIADTIVNKLNTFAENRGEEGCWYVGDPTEEYVHVD